MTKKQIMTSLASLYRLEYNQYDQLGKLAKEAVQDGDTAAFKAISRRAVNKSHFLDGIQWSAQALSIEADEFLAAVNSDKEGR